MKYIPKKIGVIEIAAHCSNCGESADVVTLCGTKHSSWQVIHLCRQCLDDALRLFEEKQA